MKSKIFTVILALFASICLMAQTSGTCGTNLRWTLNSTTGVLSISGIGRMTNWTDYSNVPWYYQKSSIKSVIINNGVTSIGKMAFGYCENLESVTIPNSVNSVGSYAFCGCSKLSSISFPNTISSVEECTFGECTSLSSFVIPNSVTNIKNAAFVLCTALTYIFIPYNVTNIEHYAFGGCSNLTTVDFMNTTPPLFETSQCFAETSCNFKVPAGTKNTYVAALNNNVFENYTIAASRVKEKSAPYGTFGTNLSWNFNSATNVLTISGSGAMEDWAYKTYTPWYSYCSSILSVIINNNVTSIGQSAFHGCTNLTSISIPNSVTTIGSHAFQDCSSLSSINLPNNLKRLGVDCFWNCTSLTSIVIPNSIDTIGLAPSAFKNCSRLTSVTFSTPCNLTYIRSNTFEGCSSLTSISIPDNVKKIESSAFRNCTNLTTVSISTSNNLSHIGGYAFDGCSSLTSISLPYSVIELGACAFYGCSSLTFFIIPNSVNNIAHSVFRDCINLSSVEFMSSTPPTINSTSSFYNTPCNFLVPYGTKNAYVAALNSKISLDYTIDASRVIEKSAYEGSCGANLTWNINTNIGTLTISGSGAMTNWEDVTDVPWYSQRDIITSIVLPNGITRIGNYAFFECNITSITIPNNVISIGESAFAVCDRLTSVVFGSGLRVIEKNGFWMCNSIQTMTCSNTRPPTVMQDAFYTIPYSNIVYVPASALSAYQTHEAWGMFDVRAMDTALEDARGDDSNGTIRKIVEDGQLFILLPNGTRYSATGKEIK